MEILERFGVNPILVAANITNFVILLLILQRFLYKPILKALEERKQKIKVSLEQTEEIETRLAATKEEQEKILKEANAEASKLIAEAGSQAKEMLEGARNQAKETSQEMVRNTRELMAAEKEKMMLELKGGLANILVSAMGRVAGKLLSSEDQKRLLLEAEKEMRS